MSVLSEKIIQLLKEQSSSLAIINTETDLFEKGILDSYSIIAFVIQIEQTFNIVFDFNDVSEDNFSSLEKIVSILKNKYNVADE